MRELKDEYRRPSSRMVVINRTAISLIALAGVVLLAVADPRGLYFMPAGILVTIVAVGANAWVLLIEINR